MSKRNTDERTRKLEPDWDERKLWRGEVGPNVADDLLEK